MARSRRHPRTMLPGLVGIALLVAIAGTCLLVFRARERTRPVVEAQDHSPLVSRRIRCFLDPKGELRDFYAVDGVGIRVFAAVDSAAQVVPEFSVRWDQVEDLSSLMGSLNIDEAIRVLGLTPLPARSSTKTSAPSLSASLRDSGASGRLVGLRIALDPGHIAGDLEMARLEQKFVVMPGMSGTGKAPETSLIEGQLTLVTAILLRDLLQREGAEVFLTREEGNMTAFGKSYAEWIRDDLLFALDEEVASGKLTSSSADRLRRLDKRGLFLEFFRDLELRQRARIINGFQPDLTVVIHYNVDEANVGWTRPTRKNFCMAFIGGNLTVEDLRNREYRLTFLRWALFNDLECSERLSAAIVQTLAATLRVPLARTKDADYLAERCISTSSPGVFCRDLALTRLVRGPLAYVEALYQDNRYETKRLMDRSVPVGVMMTSKRVRQVAQGIFAGILDYVAATPESCRTHLRQVDNAKVESSSDEQRQVFR